MEKGGRVRRDRGGIRSKIQKQKLEKEIRESKSKEEESCGTYTCLQTACFLKKKVYSRKTAKKNKSKNKRKTFFVVPYRKLSKVFPSFLRFSCLSVR